MSEYGFDYHDASDEVVAIRVELADQACTELRRAGLPVFLYDSRVEERAGAVVYVDRGADVVCGVSVGWSCDPDMIQAAADSLQRGDSAASISRYPGVVAMHMRGALIGILTSAGFTAVADDDLNPDHVQVLGRESV
ncbi:hypothetical protein [Streptomyces sp. 4F14]|uniref:hypothetical protein n=1 Tax=Streptomyces sp. 4F14 TaxID=3394380 RepID=UPI003A85D1FF